MNAETIKTSTTATTDRETLTAKIQRFATAELTRAEIAHAYNLTVDEIAERYNSMTYDEIAAAVNRQAARRNLCEFAADGEIVSVDYALIDNPAHLLRRRIAAALFPTIGANDPDQIENATAAAAEIVRKCAVPVRVTFADTLTPARVWRGVSEMMNRVRYNARRAACDYLAGDDLTENEREIVEFAAVALTINSENANRARAEKANAKALDAIDWDALTPDQIAKIRAILG